MERNYLKEKEILFIGNEGIAPASIAIQRVFAMIYDETVMNIMVCEDYYTADSIAKGSYGPDALAVECSQWGCTMGDKYINGVFYEPDGVTPVAYIPSDRERADKALTEAQYAHNRIDEVMKKLEKAVPNSMTFVEGDETTGYYINKYFAEKQNMDVVPDIANLRTLIQYLLDNPSLE